MGEEDTPGPFELGRLRGQFDAMQTQFSAHVRSTDERFNRIENKITDGFRQSQADREAGNKTLGDMIAVLGKKVEEQSEATARNSGERNLIDRIVDVVCMIFGGAGVAAAAHFFH